VIDNQILNMRIYPHLSDRKPSLDFLTSASGIEPVRLLFSKFLPK